MGVFNGLVVLSVVVSLVISVGVAVWEGRSVCDDNGFTGRRSRTLSQKPGLPNSRNCGIAWRTSSLPGS